MNIQKIKIILIPLSIVILALLLRFYNLESIPNGLYQDETAIGYNALSIVQSGSDEHGKKYPIYFESFGDFKLPTYIYSTAIAINLFGPNEFAIRSTSALAGSLTVILLFFFVMSLTKNTRLAGISSLLLAVTPWHLHFSRAGFEVNLALLFALAGTYIVYLATHSKRYYYRYLFAGVLFFLLSEYSYNVTRLLSPVLFLATIIYYRAKVINLSKFKKIYTFIVTLVILFPFISTFFIDSGLTSTTGNLLVGPDNVAKNIEFRSYMTSWPLLFQQIFFNRWVLHAWAYLENIASIFSVKFLFIDGSTHGNQGIGTTGVLYLFQFPLILLGLIYSIKNKVKSLHLLGIWLIVTILIVSLSKEMPHATRGFFLVIPFTVFTAYGVEVLISLFTNMKNRQLFRALSIICIAVLTYSLVHYFASYYFRFPIVYSTHWRSEDKKIALFIKNKEPLYKKIIIDKKANLIYTSILFYQGYDSNKLHSVQIREPKNVIGYYLLEKFDKYEYRDIKWSEFNEKDSLIIVGSNNIPTDIEPRMVFYYPTKHIATSANSAVGKYDVTEIAYAVFDSKDIINK